MLATLAPYAVAVRRRRIIGEDSRFADDLRHNSPFAGVLSEPERRRILQDVL